LHGYYILFNHSIYSYLMKKVLLVLLGLGLLGAGFGYYMWNKPPASMSSQTADLAKPAEALYAEFVADESGATAKYVGKIIAVSGKVKECRQVEGTTKVTLEAGADGEVVCEFDPQTKHKRTEIPVGEMVTFKGECAGFDFGVLLSRCAETK
jgi:tRNA_anti-like